MCPSGRSLNPNTETVFTGPDLKMAFDVLDADQDGKISTEDLKRFYAGHINCAVDNDDVIGSMISVADFNKDGFVEYDEFERLLDGIGKMINSKKSYNGVMEDVFKVMDKDGDGKLSYDDLKSYMQFAGFDANDDDIKAMIKFSGSEEKDCVSFDDLIKILCIYF